MKTATIAGILSATLIMALAENGAALELTFDGTTDNGWSLVNLSSGFDPAVEIVPIENYSGSGLAGIGLQDTTAGVSYYSAPASLFSQNLNGMTIDFNYVVTSAGVQPIPADLPDLYVDGTAIAMNIIDEGSVDSIQAVSINFDDAAFSGMDLENVTSLYIRAEWWGDDATPESYMLSAVPEPTSLSLLLTSVLLLGLVRCRLR